MQIVTVDFESFYGQEYSLSKMTTEAYVRDPRFEAILCGFKVNDGPSFFIEGPRLREYLLQLKLNESAVVMHHAHFDALILSHHYGIRPKLIIDTLGMARAIYGANARLSLAKLCEREGIGAKGDEVEKVQGMRYADFNYQALHRYGQYCKNDVDRTYDLAQLYLPQFSRAELEINDYVIRMFTEPTLQLDVDLLTKYAAQLKIDKATLMLRAGAQRDDLMSNPKFAQLLLELGIDPPMKVSPAWLKKPAEERKGDGLVYAFAKTDPGMQALAEHPNENVQALIAARTGMKSTLAETRAQRMIAMAGNGAACLYLKYSGASGSHRLCLTGDTQITVMRAGIVFEIALSTLDERDLVWDNEAFVPHGGLIDQGEQPVMHYQGITGTPDHRVYVEHDTEPVSLQEAFERSYTLKIAHRPCQQHSAVGGASGQRDEPEIPGTVAVPMRVGGSATGQRCSEQAPLWVPVLHTQHDPNCDSADGRGAGATATGNSEGGGHKSAAYVLDPVAAGVSKCEGPVHEPRKHQLQELWGPRH